MRERRGEEERRGGEGRGGEGRRERIGRIGGRGKPNGFPGFISDMLQFWTMTKSRMLHWKEWLKHNKGKTSSYGVWEGHLYGLWPNL